MKNPVLDECSVLKQFLLIYTRSHPEARLPAIPINTISPILLSTSIQSALPPATASNWSSLKGIPFLPLHKQARHQLRLQIAQICIGYACIPKKQIRLYSAFDSWGIILKTPSPCCTSFHFAHKTASLFPLP